MKILIIDDDHLQAEWIHENLERAFPSAKIEHINTELEFRSRLDGIAENPPDIVVLDVMLRWTDPSPKVQLPPDDDVIKEGFYTAGLRCEKLLAQNERTSNIPVILYTVLERADLNQHMQTTRSNVNYLAKESDPEPLIELIRDTMRQQRDS
ncbi:MAG: hypothetical protein L0229_18140 [Blastocatellia bacterium]|nr:hypothetical protein [Blastocatellia bacterium]